MATLELDPCLRKGLKLLHSKSRDSAEQLKALLEETLRQRQGKSIGIKDPFSFKRESPIPRSKQESPINTSHSKNENKRETTTKTREDDGHLSKRPKLDSPHNAFKSHTPSPTPSLKSESSSWSRKSDESDSDLDPNMNDLAMEIGINCTVCKSFEQTSGNQLVECQECHSLYHQECHVPPVSHQDVTDPRLVWYCAKCTRNLKKQTTVVSSGSGGSSSLGGIRSASSTSSSKGSSSLASSGSRPAPSPSKSSSNLQRSSPFANLSSVTKAAGTNSIISSSNSSNGNSGSLSSNSASSSASASRSNVSNSTRSSTAAPSANSIMNAERRVHLMKKKAAAKNAERRKI